ncbi:MULTISPECIES: metal-dependent hydrolase [Bacillaceae]|uniref:metal-dependent hydrolase n=1 Tax=Bacillaceae TaxID=186817 RepID=UPI0004E11EC4|nr:MULTISPECIES: metal-dependent hydrolase [Bacillaceae]MCM3361110.1 metal-dependent hydrolase [Niallia sp. MER TA 168]
MDTITHTLFGVGIYQSVNKEQMSKKEKYALLLTSIGASQIPDIDFISQLWDTTGQYQLWHRGITHSVFLAPIWALLFYIINRYIFKIKGIQSFFIALLAVFIHNTSDVFNAWGTGYLEPFSTVRLTFGTIPIVDLVIWFIFLLAFVATKIYPKVKTHLLFRIGWILIVLHIALQSIQGSILYKYYQEDYQDLALSASFIPWHFTIVGKNGDTVDIINDSLLSNAEFVERITSSNNVDLDLLFAENPAAATLYQWSPFVVVVEDNNRIGIYDPRFYRNGESFLGEYLEK